MRNRPSLTSIDTQKMMAACKTEAVKSDWRVSIAIVDSEGALLQFERLDGASPISATVALGKAQTSATLGLSSKIVQGLLSEMPAILKLPIGLPIQGAVPILYQGECIGAVGVSGVLANQDEQVAAAGVATLV
jgi:glc operon protein GlcG